MRDLSGELFAWAESAVLFSIKPITIQIILPPHCPHGAPSGQSEHNKSYCSTGSHVIIDSVLLWSLSLRRSKHMTPIVLLIHYY